MPKSVELFKDLEADGDVEMEDTKPKSAAPPGTIREVLPSISPAPTSTPVDFMDQVNAIQSKYKKPTPKPTQSSEQSSAPKQTKAPKPTPSKAPITPAPTPSKTPKPTILINEEMIESFEMPSASRIFPTSYNNILKVLLLGLLFYVLGNSRTVKFTNSLNVSSRVDSLVIHTILFALITYVVLII